MSEHSLCVYLADTQLGERVSVFVVLTLDQVSTGCCLVIAVLGLGLILKTAPSGNIDCTEFDEGLLELHNTPSPTGRSSAQVLYGRTFRSYKALEIGAVEWWPSICVEAEEDADQLHGSTCRTS